MMVSIATLWLVLEKVFADKSSCVGLDRLQRSMNTYVKSISRRGETFEDKEKGLPVAYLGRTMVTHGDDFEPDSEFGGCLIAMGQANERIAMLQEQYVSQASEHWLEGLERSLAMMKEYQVRDISAPGLLVPLTDHFYCRPPERSSRADAWRTMLA
jgi:hypothetical protein